MWFVIPSPVYLPPAIAQWKKLGGHDDDRDPLLPIWRISRQRHPLLTLVALDALYRQFYPVSTRDALMRLGQSNPALHDQCKASVERRA